MTLKSYLDKDFNSYIGYLKKGTYISIFFWITAIISIIFFDRSLSLYIFYKNIKNDYIPNYITVESIYHFIIPLDLILIFLLPTKPKFGKKYCLIIYFVLITVLTDLIKTYLKIVFGRDWPDPSSNPGKYGSLIGDNEFGFHFLHSISWQGSFPSGHATFITVTSLTTYLITEKLKYFWIAVIVIMIVCILILNFHFLGDCLGGIALGVLMSYYGIVLYQWIISKINYKLNF